MRAIAALAVTLWGLGAALAQADDADVRQAVLEKGAPYPVVVELFTSQGCSTCPPADALMAELAEEPGLLPLALHVDYWDYMGWADPFAQASHTARQQAYAHHAGRRMVFTPQMIVGGTVDLAGVRPADLAQAISELSRRQSPVRLAARIEGARLLISVEADPPLPGPVTLDLVRYLPRATVDIRGGENAGRRIDYANIVTDWLPLVRWEGAGQIRIQAVLTGPAPAALVLQEAGPGRVLAALPLP